MKCVYQITAASGEPLIEVGNSNEIIEFFKKNYNYKLPNYRREMLKRPGTSINVEIGANMFTVSKIKKEN